MFKRIKIPYFPPFFRYGSPLFFGFGIYLAFEDSLIFGFLLSLLGVVFLTTFYVKEINLKEKAYKDYFFILGLQLQKKSWKFDSVDRMIVTRNNYSRVINTRFSSRTVYWSEFTGSLIFVPHRKLKLITRNNKKDLLKDLKEFAHFLEIDVEDRTSANYYWIDLEKSINS
ncbi:MAG: hypothetical protein ACK4ND_18655 [Cytophagaceae bacterium]